MHPSEPRPPGNGRPSLLSQEQSTPDNPNSILSGLDGKSKPAAAPPAAPVRRGYMRWVAGGMLVTAACVGLATWVANGDDEDMVAATAEPVVAQPPTPATLTPVPAPAAPSLPVGEEVSTAAILEDTPAGVANPSPDEAKTEKDELVTLFEPPAAPAPKPAVKVIKEQPPAPAKKKMAEAPKPAAKKTVASVPKAPPRKQLAQRAPAKDKNVKVAQAAEKKQTTEPAKPAVVQDPDLTLLAALVAHSKKPSVRASDANAAKFRKCKGLGSVAEADQCKAKLCAGSAKADPVCKSPTLAKATTET